MSNYILKGNIIYSKSNHELAMIPNGYVVCEDKTCRGAYTEIPEQFKDYELIDYGNQLIIPGMSDLHLHAPQYTVCGYAMDLELMAWLNAYIFPAESKYKDFDYAKEAYARFVKDLVQSPTTRICAFATLHTEGTLELMRQLEDAGFFGYVGKVSMDRNSPDILCETDGKENLLEWLKQCNFKHIHPILTPRFIPTCSDELMTAIGEIQKKTHLPLQSHLSENSIEIQFVQELVPESKFYGDAYDLFGTFGTNGNTVMAHCVYSDDEEIARMKKNGVYVAHCAESNFNLSSGIAPARKFMNAELNMGLGTDIGAGSSISMFRAIKEAIVASKMYWRLVDSSMAPLRVEEAFYLATAGGGSFFGKVGSFEDGYDFDAVIINDEKIYKPVPEKLEDRLERVIYADNCNTITDKYICGKRIVL